MEVVLSRRSIRKYQGGAVAPEQVRQLLAAAMAAPSAGNQQAWHFVVIDDRRVLDQPPSFHPNSTMLREAPLAIAVCADLDRCTHGAMWVQDCSAATENLLLAAHALGLGAVWLGIYPREERVAGLRQLLGLPDHVMPLSLVAIGHPGEKKPPAERFDESRIHHNHW